MKISNEKKKYDFSGSDRIHVRHFDHSVGGEAGAVQEFGGCDIERAAFDNPALGFALGLVSIDFMIKTCRILVPT